MPPIFPPDLASEANVNQLPAPKVSVHYRFCSGKCQDERPTEGGIELSPGRWRCGACWMEMARKRS